MPDIAKIKAHSAQLPPRSGVASSKGQAPQFGEAVWCVSCRSTTRSPCPSARSVHLLITSNDVIHSWTIPSFGSKMQAVPGRVTATWFRADKIGVYYGQCSVLCGKAAFGHADRRSRRRRQGLCRLGRRREGARSAEGARRSCSRRPPSIEPKTFAELDAGGPPSSNRSPTSKPSSGIVTGPVPAVPDKTSEDKVIATWLTAKLHTRTDHGHMITTTRPGSSRVGSSRPTTRTSARCTCCSR